MAKESGMYVPKQPAMLSPSYLMSDPFFGPPMAPRTLNGHPSGQHMDSSGMRDMVSMVPSLYMGQCVFSFIINLYLFRSVQYHTARLRLVEIVIGLLQFSLLSATVKGFVKLANFC